MDQATAEALSDAAIERELAQFEARERERLGIVEKKAEHWFDANPQKFTRDQREKTTLLIGGLTVAQDYLVAAAFDGLGYTVEALQVPDNEALRVGKEFGNRGQCNPTYFTVGNLVLTLMKLRDEKGLTPEEIVDRYVFLTAGSCGPCRFGTYVTEYRKALRDAGFDGFRVMLFQQQGGLKQATGEAAGLELNPKFFAGMLKSLMVGDILNAIGYRLRPYEVEAGSTDKALYEARELVATALRQQKSIIPALFRARRVLSRVKVDRTQAKPKVSIIGEFWAMTTEGDGNYKLQRFLEQEGAEVDVQLVTAWLLYNIWQHRWDTKRRMTLRQDDSDPKSGLAGKNIQKKLVTLTVAEVLLRSVFKALSLMTGLNGYKLPDMEEIATISHQYYDNHLRGGEGHMEVGKLIQTAKKKKAHMVISVKPFGCMPSSGVSDGIQSLISNKYPEAIFTAIETTGDGAVNVQSRVQMDLFKARQAAASEYERTLGELGIDHEQLKGWLAALPALRYPAHQVAGTAANAAHALAKLRQQPLSRVASRVASWLAF
ncbi:MAG: 2-hydroxyglutaryl-CoA dehydratase [Deltaproteobacteria bacterium]|nr:2-hydroxyglutaryl-CoA dehydratase [Deltaproteobacteria bacterium]